MATIFTKIIQGEIPCHKIAETDDYLAFLDINPIAEAHTLVVPKKEVDYIFDVEDDLLGGMMVFAKKVARALDKSVLCTRVGVMVIGLEVPHAHIHLVPMRKMSDMNFTKPKLDKTHQELAEMAAHIRQVFEKLYP